MNAGYNRTICPSCGSEHLDRIALNRAECLVAKWQHDMDIDVRPYFRGIDSVELRSCKMCDLQFFVPPIVGDGPFYAQLQKRDWYYMSDKWEHRVALSQVPRGGRVCEIGCGVGAFVGCVNRAGMGRAIGIETNREAVDNARANGIPVEFARVEEYEASHGAAMDVVCAFQVLEHVEDPRSFVMAATQLLRPAGLLILSVPNRASFIRWHNWVTDLPPHHVTRWSDRAMVNLFRAAGLQNLRVRYEPLQTYHAEAYAVSWKIRTRGRPFGAIVGHWRIERLLKRFARCDLFRCLIRGHTLCVSGHMPT